MTGLAVAIVLAIVSPTASLYATLSYNLSCVVGRSDVPFVVVNVALFRTYDLQFLSAPAQQIWAENIGFQLVYSTASQAAYSQALLPFFTGVNFASVPEIVLFVTLKFYSPSILPPVWVTVINSNSIAVSSRANESSVLQPGVMGSMALGSTLCQHGGIRVPIMFDDRRLAPSAPGGPDVGVATTLFVCDAVELAPLSVRPPLVLFLQWENWAVDALIALNGLTFLFEGQCYNIKSEFSVQVAAADYIPWTLDFAWVLPATAYTIKEPFLFCNQTWWKAMLLSNQSSSLDWRVLVQVSPTSVTVALSNRGDIDANVTVTAKCNFLTLGPFWQIIHVAVNQSIAVPLTLTTPFILAEFHSNYEIEDICELHFLVIGKRRRLWSHNGKDVSVKFALTLLEGLVQPIFRVVESYFDEEQNDREFANTTMLPVFDVYTTSTRAPQSRGQTLALPDWALKFLIAVMALVLVASTVCAFSRHCRCCGLSREGRAMVLAPTMTSAAYSSFVLESPA